ncbi:MAG: SIS domain-containing protein [Candidatus Protistobacter heckmanni]|nr:SIS domain-containing protein [Candidatus Protistobacter heckmanni]
MLRGEEFFQDYAERLKRTIDLTDHGAILRLAQSFRDVWASGNQLLLCGNGGSAGNATHLANDYLYGIAKGKFPGLRVHSLAANSAILTCLGNDLGYSEIFAEQVKVYARPGDLLGVLSGSGNSPNVVKALETAKDMGVKTFAILGYSGGKCCDLVDIPIHFAVDDMQISEDMQVIVGHMLMQWLWANPPQAGN